MSKVVVTKHTIAKKFKKKEQKEEAKAEDNTAAEEEPEAPVLLFTQVNTISHSIFSNADVYISNQQIYNANGL